jgi:hypothetical protein
MNLSLLYLWLLDATTQWIMFNDFGFVYVAAHVVFLICGYSNIPYNCLYSDVLMVKPCALFTRLWTVLPYNVDSCFYLSTFLTVSYTFVCDFLMLTMVYIHNGEVTYMLLYKTHAHSSPLCNDVCTILHL